MNQPARTTRTRTNGPAITSMALVLAAVVIAAAGCGGSDASSAPSSPSSSPTAPATAASTTAPAAPATSTRPSQAAVNLDGTWRTTSKDPDDPCFEAEISGGTIVVDMCDLADPSYSELYWKGTFPVGDAPEVVSAGDMAAMDSALLASQDKTKRFTAKDGKLTFRFSGFGTTLDLHLERR